MSGANFGTMGCLWALWALRIHGLPTHVLQYIKRNSVQFGLLSSFLDKQIQHTEFSVAPLNCIMVPLQLKLLQLQFTAGFSESINPGLERSEITNHTPATQLTENLFTGTSPINNAMSKLDKLHLDHPPASQEKPRDHLETTRLLHVPIRLAQFSHILMHPSLVHSDALLTPLTTFGCVSLSSNCGDRGNSEGRTTQSQQRAVLDGIVLECAFCNASISLASIFARANNNAKLTVELLETLATEHAVGCRGRKGLDLMHADDAQLGVSEGVTEHKLNTNAFFGTSCCFSTPLKKF